MRRGYWEKCDVLDVSRVCLVNGVEVQCREFLSQSHLLSL
jgi:hypothetical protein